MEGWQPIETAPPGTWAMVRWIKDGKLIDQLTDLLPTEDAAWWRTIGMVDWRLPTEAELNTGNRLHRDPEHDPLASLEWLASEADDGMDPPLSWRWAQVLRMAAEALAAKLREGQG